MSQIDPLARSRSRPDPANHMERFRVQSSYGRRPIGSLPSQRAPAPSREPRPLSSQNTMAEQYLNSVGDPFGALRGLGSDRRQMQPPRYEREPSPAPPKITKEEQGRKLSFSESAWAIVANEPTRRRRSADAGELSDDEPSTAAEGVAAASIDVGSSEVENLAIGSIPLRPASRKPARSSAAVVEDDTPLLHHYMALPIGSQESRTILPPR